MRLELAAELSNRKGLLELFRDAKINLSVLGFGLEMDGVPPVTENTVARFAIDCFVTILLISLFSLSCAVATCVPLFGVMFITLAVT